jgi:hypothetical protein
MNKKPLHKEFLDSIRRDPHRFYNDNFDIPIGDYKRVHEFYLLTKNTSDKELFDIVVKDNKIYKTDFRYLDTNNNMQLVTIVDLKNSFDQCHSILNDKTEMKFDEILKIQKNQSVIIDKLEKYITAMFDKVNVLAEAVELLDKENNEGFGSIE